MRWREIVASLAPGPVSLLVIPHDGGDPSLPAPLAAWLAERTRAGDELVLHGLTHRRVDGRDGAELAGRDAVAVRTRVMAGALALGTAGLGARGFIAPAYAHPPTLDAACREAGLGWWATRTTLRSAHGRRFVPSLGAGASTVARRLLSPRALRLGVRALGAAPTVRLDLHPADLDHPHLVRATTSAVAELLRQGRVPVRHRDLLDPVEPAFAFAGSDLRVWEAGAG